MINFTQLAWRMLNRLETESEYPEYSRDSDDDAGIILLGLFGLALFCLGLGTLAVYLVAR